MTFCKLDEFRHHKLAMCVDGMGGHRGEVLAGPATISFALGRMLIIISRRETYVGRQITMKEREREGEREREREKEGQCPT